MNQNLTHKGEELKTPRAYDQPNLTLVLLDSHVFMLASTETSAYDNGTQDVDFNFDGFSE